MRHYADVVDAYNRGRFHEAQVRKVAGSVPAGMWFDLSYTAGIPLPNYYASVPLVLDVLDGNKGIIKGSRSTGKKYLHKILLSQLGTTTGYTASHAMVCDYVAYYPFIDLDSTDEQTMDNTVSFPRYSDGKGLRIIPVMQGAGTGNVNLTVWYINSNDEEVSKTTTLNAAQAAGVVASMNRATVGAFSYLDSGDGVKQITRVICNVAVGAICALVIIKPLATLTIPELYTPSEVDLVAERGSLVDVHNDAYVNLLITQNATSSNITPALHGQITFVWED